MNDEELAGIFFTVTNRIKRTGFSTDVVSMDFHLGGDLGIDSREMLEVWYDLEKFLNIEVHDFEKRDLYTVEDVVRLLRSKVLSVSA